MSTVEQIYTTVEKLKSVTDEQAIKKIVTEAWTQLKEKVPNENTFSKKVRAPLRKAIEDKFPSSDTEKPGYYLTKTGKGKSDRWEHLALWYATVNQQRWEIVGDEARSQYWDNLPPFKSTETVDSSDTTSATETVSTPEPVNPQVETETQPTLSINNMHLDQFELDPETQQAVTDAIAYSGVSLADFIKQSFKVYANTLIGKSKQFQADLSGVPTSTLLVTPKYKTHPGRAEELVKRAIVAQKKFNDNCPEKHLRWCITQTSLQGLTGSKPNTIKEILARKSDPNDTKGTLQKIIDEHNEKHELKADDNRKGKGRNVADEVNLCSLVPDGVDLQ